MLYSAILWTVTHQSPLSVGFSRQEYWSGMPCPPPGNIANPGSEHLYPATPASQADSLPLSHQGSQLLHIYVYAHKFCICALLQNTFLDY